MGKHKIYKKEVNGTEDHKSRLETRLEIEVEVEVQIRFLGGGVPPNRTSANCKTLYGVLYLALGDAPCGASYSHCSAVSRMPRSGGTTINMLWAVAQSPSHRGLLFCALLGQVR